MANESKNMLKVMARVVIFVMEYLAATSARPGAIIELAKGETNVYIDICMGQSWL